MATIIETLHLTKRFKKLTAVNDLNLRIEEGDTFGFLGPNGSGKSTTIRMLLSLVRADEGKIEIFGLRLKQHHKKILGRIGALVEEPDFYEYLSAYKNLELLSFYTGKPASPERIAEVLELVGLKKRALSIVKTYSKGMKQRLGIAQALIHDPELLILDEPGIGLDPAGVKDIRELIRYLNAELNKTIFLSSHQLNEIEQLSNRMIIINNGRKVVEGSVEELLQKHHFHTRFQVDDPQRAIRYIRKRSGGIFVYITVKHLRYIYYFVTPTFLTFTHLTYNITEENLYFFLILPNLSIATTLLIT